jgi:hypothetical protein
VHMSSHKAQCVKMKLRRMTQAMTHPRRQEMLCHILHKVAWPLPPLLKGRPRTVRVRYCRDVDIVHNHSRGLEHLPKAWTESMRVARDNCPRPCARLW